MSQKTFGLESVGPDFEKLSEKVSFREVESTERRLAEVAAATGLQLNDGFRRLAYRLGLEQLEALARRGLRLQP